MSESKDALKKLDKAVASVTKGSDRKEDMMMMVAPYANWGEFIVPAPLSIAILGELILISAESDFSLEKKPPKDGFKLLRYPSSFRACLVQVSNAGWEAFNEAHTSMDQIRLLSGNVDAHVRNAVKFLVGGNDKEVEIMVPKALKNVQRIADDCVSLVTSVEDKFLDVMKLTAELLEACTNARGQYEEELRETEIAIDVARQQEAMAKEQKENAQKQYNEMKKDMQDCQQMMKDAVSSMPSGWDLLGMKVVEGVTSGVTNLLNSFSSNVFRTSPKSAPTHSGGKDHEETSTGREAPQQRTNRRIYSKVPLFVAQVFALGSLFNGDQPIWEEIEKKMGFIQARLERIQGDIDDLDDTPLRKQVSDLCLLAVQVCKNLGQASKDFSRDEGEVRETVRCFKKLQKDVDALNVQAKHATGANPMGANGPHLSKAQSAGGASTSVVESVVQNAHKQIDTAKEMIKNSQGRYDNSCMSLKESNDELGKVLADLARYDLKKIDFEKIRETLIKGIKALAKLREQWGKMVRFFQMISNLIKCCMSTSLTDFIESTKSGQQMVLEGLSLSNMMRDTIYEQAFQASKISYVVQMISGTYVEISNQHLMDRITCLGHLVGLDPKTDKHEILKKRLELHSGCKAAQKAIGKLVMEKKRDFDEQMDNRVAKIERQMKDALPARSPAAIKESEESIKKTLEKMDEADVDQFA